MKECFGASVWVLGPGPSWLFHWIVATSWARQGLLLPFVFQELGGSGRLDHVP